MLIILHPNKPRNPRPGQPVDSFIAELPDGTRLKPQRVPVYGTARKLAELGYPDDTPLEYQHTGAAYVAARGVLGELKKWTVQDSGSQGMRRVPYVPYGGVED